MNTTISPRERDEIRKKLALRFNTLYNCYEVFTTIHGSGIFRWMKITDETAEWYKRTFKLAVTEYIKPSVVTGGILRLTTKPANPAPNSSAT